MISTAERATLVIGVAWLGLATLACKGNKVAPVATTTPSETAIATAAVSAPADDPVDAAPAAPTATATAVKNPCKDGEQIARGVCRQSCRADMDCDGTNFDCLPVANKGYKVCQPALDSEASIGEADLVSGGCSAGWLEAEGQCHRVCKGDNECQPPTSYCKKWQGKRLCARTGSLVVPMD